MHLLKRRCNYGRSKISYNVRQVQHISINTYSTKSYDNRIPELGAAYVPSEVEGSGLSETLFKPPLRSSQHFSMILPPPNITGTLHLGHALTVTIQDVLVKWYRMRGVETLWVPGIDHAGIATQVIVEKKLWTEKKLTRHDIGRVAFEKEVWKWKEQKVETIVGQLRRLGASLDWNREMFTMDTKHAEAVTEAFLRLHAAGMIYEADSLVNWSCSLRSAISDIEVDHLEINKPTPINVPGCDKPVEFGWLTNFAYKFTENDDEIVVATTRPETLFGDVAVAVHPNDERYSNFIGRHLQHPFRPNDQIPVIADPFVDPNFGTGAVKITPAHDRADFEVAQRHHLKPIHVINENGNIKTTNDQFNGLPRFEARDRVIAALRDLGLHRGQQEHAGVVPVCSRSGDVIELLMKPQWFLKCDKMAERALQDVREGRLVIDPAQFEKVWSNWLENSRDWCISRQLWWGHRIPIYVCSSKTNAEVTYKIAAVDENSARIQAKKLFDGDNIVVRQVEDVLDTWFSSALLPFSTMGWPKTTPDFEKYYPISLMETGHDIIFFWVARMVMLGTQLTAKLPFGKILLHGVICDSSGRKMSKSLGNVISPEDVIEGRTLKDLEESSQLSHSSGVLSATELQRAVQGQKRMFPEGIPECGVDALRLTLCSHNIKSHYTNFDVQECRTNKLFGNKLWQATKFTLKWCGGSSNKVVSDATPMDEWILSRMAAMVERVEEAMERRELHNAVGAIKGFLYYEFCDVFLEAAKPGLRSPDSPHRRSLVTVLDVGLRCLAPFMPHLCQRLHAQLPHTAAPVYYPQSQEMLPWRNLRLEEEVGVVLEVVTVIRRLKKLFNVSAKHKAKDVLITSAAHFDIHAGTVAQLTGCQGVAVLASPSSDLECYVKDTVGDVTVYLDVSEELRRSFEVDARGMDKKRERLVKDLGKLRVMMDADGYKKKVFGDAHENNLKKVSNLEEKIARIDYVQGFSRKSQRT